MERSFEPLVGYVNFKCALSTETANCFDWINLLRRRPVLNLDESVVEGYSLLVVTKIDVNTEINKKLFSFKGGICRCA